MINVITDVFCPLFMKVLRVTQDLLRRPSGLKPIKLQLRPDLILEAGPKIIHPLNRSEEGRGKWLGWLLPEGYPQSVHENYLKFSLWTGLQGVTASFIGVLSTQAMLGALMNLSTGENEEGGWLSKGTAAATINWILKDGLGQAGGIALVSLLGSRLDSQARFLRFHSTILFLIGSLLEFSIPFAVGNLSMLSDSNVFLLLASTANILKNVSWMVVSATRAHFMKNFALKGNLGDLTGKAGSQMTLASLIGTGLGLAVLKSEDSLVESRNLLVAGCWALSAALSVLATHRSCKVGLSRQLNPQRIFKIIETFSKNRSEKGPISRYFWTPEILASRENFVFKKEMRKEKSFDLRLNPSLSILSTDTCNLNWIVPVDEIESKKFCLAAQSNAEIYNIWTLETATPQDKLISIIKAALWHFELTEIGAEEVVEALRRQGWDVEHFSCKELDDKRRALQLTIDKDE